MNSESIGSVNPIHLRPHPKASIVPPISDSQYEELRESVREQGILVPIEIFEYRDGQGRESLVILDGHTRVRAALELGLPTVPVREVKTDNEELYMLTTNIIRRHMDHASRMAILLKVLTIRRGYSSPENRSDLYNPMSHDERADLAKQTGLGEVTVRGMDRLLRENQDEVAADVAAGKITVAKAMLDLTKGPPVVPAIAPDHLADAIQDLEPLREWAAAGRKLIVALPKSRSVSEPTFVQTAAEILMHMSVDARAGAVALTNPSGPKPSQDEWTRINARRKEDAAITTETTARAVAREDTPGHESPPSGWTDSRVSETVEHTEKCEECGGRVAADRDEWICLSCGVVQT